MWERYGGPLDDPNPRLPFWFLQDEGLQEINKILSIGPSNGHPQRCEPELVIYGSDRTN